MVAAAPLVAPFGGVEKMLVDIRRNEFPGRVLKLLVPDPLTGGVSFREIPAWMDQSGTNKSEEEQR